MSRARPAHTFSAAQTVMLHNLLTSSLSNQPEERVTCARHSPDRGMFDCAMHNYTAVVYTAGTVN